MIRGFFVGVCFLGALGACARHRAADVVINSFGTYMWMAHPPTRRRAS